MMAHHPEDQMLQQVGLLRALSPDPARAEQVRARCRARLERTRRSERSTALSDAEWLLAPLVAGCACGLYFADLVGIALRLQGLFE